MTSKASSNYLILPAASHEEPPRRFNGIAPCGYSCIVIRPDQSRTFLNGYGGEKSTSVMLAHSAAIGINAVLMEDPDAMSFHCIMEKVEFWDTQTSIVFQQLAAGKFFADGHNAYRHLIALQATVDLRPRQPRNSDEQALIAHTKMIARQTASEALKDRLRNPKRYETPGVYVERDTLPSEL